MKVSDADSQEVLRRAPVAVRRPGAARRRAHPRQEEGARRPALHADQGAARTSRSSRRSTRRIRARRSGRQADDLEGPDRRAVRPDRVPAARPAQVSHPIKTDFGYHIIKALGAVKAAKTTPFTKVKASIKQQLLQQKKNEAMTTWSNKLKKDFNGKISYQTGYAPPATTTAATTDSIVARPRGGPGRAAGADAPLAARLSVGSRADRRARSSRTRSRRRTRSRTRRWRRRREAARRARRSALPGLLPRAAARGARRRAISSRRRG